MSAITVDAGSCSSASTSVRWRVVAALCALSFLTIIDRVCISAAKNAIASDLTIPDQMFGFIFGAFALGYGLCMAPSGWAADRLGPRRFLAIIVALWSLLTFQTGLVSSPVILVAVRFLFGAAEAGAYPTAARAIYSWLPRQERGLALGLLNAGSRLGAAMGLSLVSASIVAVGWRVSFAILGGCGIIWAVWWHGWYRDDPTSKRGVSPAEAQLIQSSAAAASAPGSTFRPKLLSEGAICLVLQYFCSNFTFFLCFSWLLPYLREHFALGPQQAGLYASVPLYCGALATWCGGLIVDVVYRRGFWNQSRRLPAMAGFGLAAVCLIAASQAVTVISFVLWFSLTTFGVDLTLSSSWSAAADLGGPRTGTLSACMNTAGSLGAFASSVLFPWLVRHTGSVTPYFLLAAALNVGAVLLWLRLKLSPGTGDTT